MYGWVEQKAIGSRVCRLLVPWIHVDVPRLLSFNCLERVRDISRRVNLCQEIYICK